MTPEVFLSSARILNHRLWKWWLRFSMIISVKKRKLLVSWSLKNHWVVRSNNHHSLQTQRSTFQNNYIVNGVIGLIRITASIIISMVSTSDSLTLYRGTFPHPTGTYWHNLHERFLFFAQLIIQFSVAKSVKGYWDQVIIGFWLIRR